MIIETVVAKKFRGWFDCHVNFKPVTCLIGLNGCGKTTLLELIAGLTGTDAATRLVQFNHCESVVITVRDGRRKRKFTVTGDFNAKEINAFKATLSTRSSFLLQHDTYDNSLMTLPRDPFLNAAHLFSFLESHDLPLRMHFDGRCADFMIHHPSGQGYLVEVAFRLPPPNVPMLIEAPDRHLHLDLQRHVVDFYNTDQNQIILTSHSPDVVCRMDDANIVELGRQPPSRPKQPNF